MRRPARSSASNLSMTIHQQFVANLLRYVDPDLSGREIEPDAVSEEHSFGAAGHILPGNSKRLLEHSDSGIPEEAARFGVRQKVNAGTIGACHTPQTMFRIEAPNDAFVALAGKRTLIRIVSFEAALIAHVP